ncbi:hypothetical protein PMZ80_011114 [Knufia obscura]|uniref:Uncharacterized protein n=1 Tax=Knufia obscura TaxID=1635080 RepID=A0ABR0R8Y0_9EURO|nr:hypothetical protein PMZ80_011114 [Knufia obscura]
MHQRPDIPAEARLLGFHEKSRHQLFPCHPINATNTATTPFSATRWSGRVLGEEGDDSVIGQSAESDNEEQGTSRMQDQVSQAQLMSTLLYLYYVFSQLGRRQTESYPAIDDSVDERSPETHRSHDIRSESIRQGSNNIYTSSRELVRLGQGVAENDHQSSLVPVSNQQVRPHHTMDTQNNSSRPGNNAPPQSHGLEGIIGAFMSHPDFRPGQIHGHTTVNADGINHQGNITGTQTQQEYRSHIFTSTTVSGTNFQGDIPPELARELAMAQQQQQTPISHGQLYGQQSQTVSRPIAPGSNVHSFAQSGPGHRLG